jgi:hypothetical protein
MAINTMKPYRPFGLSLALIVSVIVYSVIPLTTVVTLLYLNSWVYQEPKSGISGISVLGISAAPLMANGVIAVLFFILAVVAWRGRRPTMRVIFPAVTVFYALFMLGAMLNNGGDGLQNGIDSTTQFRTDATRFYAVVIVCVTLYVCFYLNRWASRAFYRGYYTKEDLRLMEEMRLTTPQTGNAQSLQN